MPHASAHSLMDKFLLEFYSLWAEPLVAALSCRNLCIETNRRKLEGNERGKFCGNTACGVNGTLNLSKELFG